VLQGRFAAVLKAANGNETHAACQRLADDEVHLNTFTILPFTNDAVQTFDRLRDDRRTRRIGRPDLLIASITLAHRATLVTRNVRHFQLVPGLRVENWMD
jgi:tRNA(fMet)-specific endonuclease VapC